MVTRLSGGLTPADGADPRTFPTIWNATATTIETQGSAITAAESDITVLQGTAVTLGSAVDAIEAWVLDDLNDVTIGTAVSDGQVLAYSTAVSGWVNQDASAGGGGAILQVVSTTKTAPSAIAVSAGTFSSNITGLEATITPTSTDSKILVQLSLTGSRVNDVPFLYARLVRGATPIGVGTTSGSRPALTTAQDIDISDRTLSVASISAIHIDEPASTSALTYGVQLYSPDSKTYGICRTSGDNDNNAHGRLISNITVMEIAG